MCIGLKVQAVTNCIPDVELERQLKNSLYENAESRAKKRLSAKLNLSANEKLYYTNALGMAEFRLMKLDSALLSSQTAMRLCSKATDSLLILDTWKLVAYTYNYLGKLDSSLLYSNKILTYGKRHNNLQRTGEALASIATIFSQKKNHKYALKLYKEFEVIAIKRRDSVWFSTANFNIALMYLNLNQYDSSVVRFNRAIYWSTKFNKKELLVSSYGSLAFCFLKMGKIDLWKTTLEKSILLAIEIHNYQSVAMSYMDLMEYELGNKNIVAAIKYGEKASDNLKNHHYLILQMKLDSLLYVSYKTIGDNKTGIKYLESFMERKYEFEDKNSESILSEFKAKNEQLNNEMLIAEQKIELNKKNRTLYVLFTVLIIIVVIIISYSLWMIRLKKLRHQLFLKEKTMELQMEENKEWLEWKLNKSPAFETNAEYPTNNTATNAAETLIHKRIFLELRELFETKKLYLNPNLDIDLVIKELGTNKKYLYYAINSNSENFRSFLNRYRIEEAKELIRNSIKNNTSPNFTEIYENTGFNSNVTFYRAFKLVTGLTPKEYATEYNNESNSNI